MKAELDREHLERLVEYRDARRREYLAARELFERAQRNVSAAKKRLREQARSVNTKA